MADIYKLRRRTGGTGDPPDPHAFGQMDGAELLEDIDRHLIEALAFAARLARSEIAHLESQAPGTVEPAKLEEWRALVSRCLDERKTLRADSPETAPRPQSRRRTT